MSAIKINHYKGCDCLDCIKDTVFSKHVNRASQPFWLMPENLEGKASDFIGADLVATTDVGIFSQPNGTFIKTIPAGKKIGVIYSYIQLPDGSVWWELDDLKSWVKHEKGKFDELAISESLKRNEAAKQSQIDKAVKARQDANKSTLYNTGKFFQDIFSFDGLEKIIVGVIVVILGAILLRIFK